MPRLRVGSVHAENLLSTERSCRAASGVEEFFVGKVVQEFEDATRPNSNSARSTVADHSIPALSRM